MIRYKLRTLLIVLALGPMVLAWWGWPKLQDLFWPPKPASMKMDPQWTDPDELPLGIKRSPPAVPPVESFAPPDRRP